SAWSERALPASALFVKHTSITSISTLSLHDALPISSEQIGVVDGVSDFVPEDLHAPFFGAAFGLEHLRLFELRQARVGQVEGDRSEEHTSELQSRENIVCRLLLEKKKTQGRSVRARA